MIDVHRRWATEKNERMRIILEVTHTDDCSFSAVYQQKKGYGEVCKMNPSGRGHWKRVSHCTTWLRVCVVFVCEDRPPSVPEGTATKLVICGHKAHKERQEKEKRQIVGEILS